MYSEAPKLELNLDDDFKRNFHFLGNLCLAARLLGIRDLGQFLEEHFPLLEENGLLPIKEEDESVYGADGINSNGDNAVENVNREGDIWCVRDQADVSEDDIDDEIGNGIDRENRTRLVPLLERLSNLEGENGESFSTFKTEISDEASVSKSPSNKLPSTALKIKRPRPSYDDLTPEQRKRRKKGPIVSCEKCGMNVRKYELTNHHKTHHGPERRNVRPHWKNRPSIDPILAPCVKDKIFRCSLCDFVKSKSEVNGTSNRFLYHCARHFYQKHGILCPNLAFPCPEENCGAVLYGLVGFKNHKIKVHEEAGQKTPCPICGLEMKEGSMKTHIFLLHNRDHVECPCKICGKVFSNPFYLKMHTRHHKEKQKIFCEHCDFEATNLEVFTQHSYREHGMLLPEGTELHECTECDYKSPVKRNFVNHAKKHVESFIQCPAPDCQKSFKRQRLCDEHFRRVHRSKDTSKCPECDQVFHSQTGIRYHLWRVHRIGKNGSVQDDADFRLERPFKCAYCNHTSGLSGNVRKHVKNIHPELPIEYIDLRKVQIAAAELVRNRNVSPISDRTCDSEIT